MKNLSQHIIEYDIRTYIKFPDMSESKLVEIINEELNEPHLLALAKQLHDDKKAGKSGYNFAELFYNGFRIKWDQIDSSNVQEFDRIDQKAIQAARSVLTKGNGCVLITDADWRYKYMYTSGGGADKRKFILDRDSAYYGSSARYGLQVRATEAYSEMERYGGHMVIISWNYNEVITWDIQSQRAKNKEGMIPQGQDYENYCKNLAKSNLKRYKEIVAANKAKSTADLKPINDLVSKAMDRMMRAMEKVQKDPVAWADKTWELSGLMDRINGKRVWIGNEKGHRWSDPSYRGSNGILELYKQYNDLYVSTVGKKDTYMDASKLNDELKKLEQSIKDEYTYLKQHYFDEFGV